MSAFRNSPGKCCCGDGPCLVFDQTEDSLTAMWGDDVTTSDTTVVIAPDEVLTSRTVLPLTDYRISFLPDVPDGQTLVVTVEGEEIRISRIDDVETKSEPNGPAFSRTTKSDPITWDTGDVDYYKIEFAGEAIIREINLAQPTLALNICRSEASIVVQVDDTLAELSDPEAAMSIAKAMSEARANRVIELENDVAYYGTNATIDQMEITKPDGVDCLHCHTARLRVCNSNEIDFAMDWRVELTGLPATAYAESGTGAGYAADWGIISDAAYADPHDAWRLDVRWLHTDPSLAAHTSPLNYPGFLLGWGAIRGEHPHLISQHANAYINPWMKIRYDTVASTYTVEAWAGYYSSAYSGGVSSLYYSPLSWEYELETPIDCCTEFLFPVSEATIAFVDPFGATDPNPSHAATALKFKCVS